jgi:hypothetical protein
MAKKIVFVLNEGDPGAHGHTPTWCEVLPLAGLPGYAEVTDGGSCSSCWQCGHDRDVPPQPIGLVVELQESCDSGERIVERFPFRVAGGVLGIGLIRDFLAKKASFAELRDALATSATLEVDNRVMYS